MGISTSGRLSKEDLGHPVDLTICMDLSDNLGQDLAAIHNSKLAMNLMIHEIFELRHQLLKKLADGVDSETSLCYNKTKEED